MRLATGIALQPHQILHLPRKMTTQHLTEICWKQLKRHFQCATDPRMIRAWSENDPRPFRPRKRKTEPAAPPRRFYWKLHAFPAPAIIPNFTTCCACHEKWHMNFTKCCTCHEKWISWLIRITYETSFTMRGATVNTLQPHQILRLPCKMTTQHRTEICWKQLKRHFQCATDPRMIRAWSENDPRPFRPRKRKTEPAAPPRLLFALARSRFYWKLQRFPLRLSFQISPHAAPATKSDTWTLPNAAPATKSDT